MVNAIRIPNKGLFDAWLEDQQRELGQVIAARAALRVLPLAGLSFADSQYVCRTMFRAAFLSWAAIRYPERDLKKAAEAVQRAGDSIVAIAGDATVHARRSTTAAIAAAGEFHNDSQIAEAQAFIEVGVAVESAAAAVGDSGAEIWASVSADVNWLESRSEEGTAKEQAAQLASQRLWLEDVRGDDKYRVNFPIWARRAWDAFKKIDGINDAGFDIWIGWYERRLRGDDTDGFNPLLKGKAAQELDIRITTQSEEFWNRDSSSVNSEIKSWIEEALEKPLYNLIMTAKRGEWDDGSATVLRSRFLEHTADPIAERFRSLDSVVVPRLMALPTLFAYETGIESAARVGRLRDIHVKAGTLDIWFEYDPSILPISPEKFSEIRERLGINNLEQHRTHWAIKNIDLYSALSDVGISPVELETDTDVAPPEPSSGPGPQYRPHNGKLSEVASLPAEGEAAQQASLHRLLQRDAITLAENFQRAANRYPELAGTAGEYSKLLDSEIASADVAAIWSVGGSLASFAQSYREQNAARTLAEPLEPQLDALLQSVVRQHGAFIMGFEEGRDLVQRADEFTVDTARLREIEEPGSVLLKELTENRDLVDDRTRELHRPVRDSVTEFGWASSRVGYSAYLIVRNGVRAMIKFSVGDDPNIGIILGLLAGGSALAGDPNAEFIRAAVPVLQQYGSQLLAFFNHSPEMRAYVEWALQVLKDDHEAKIAP